MSFFSWILCRSMIPMAFFGIGMNHPAFDEYNNITNAWHYSYFLPCKMLQPSDSCTWVSRSHSVPSPPCSSWCSRPATRHSTPTQSPCPLSWGSWSAPDIPATSSRWSSHEGWFICDVLCKENPKSKAESIKGIDTTMWLGKKGSKLELHFCCWFFTHPELTK